MRSILIAFLVMLSAGVAAAAPSQVPLLAVLDFDAPEEAATLNELQLLSDGFRSAVIKAVGDRYRVMTRETMMELVPPEQMKCFADKCVADIGRMLQAPYVMAGSVRALGTKRVLTVEAYESTGGRALGTEQLISAGVEQLLMDVADKGRGWVRTWMRLDEAAPASMAPPKRFESDPPGALVQVDGVTVCTAAPCEAPLIPGQHTITMQKDGYQDASATNVYPAEQRLVRLALIPAPAMLSVETNPSGRELRVDGKAVGPSPLLNYPVTPGAHEVTVVAGACEEGLKRKVTVAPGLPNKLQMELAPRMAMLNVAAVDEDGDAVAAKILVDGEDQGRTPRRFSVPVCSQKLVVRFPDGHEVAQDLKLVEGKTQTLRLKAGGDEVKQGVAEVGSEEKHWGLRGVALSASGAAGVELAYTFNNLELAGTYGVASGASAGWYFGPVVLRVGGLMYSSAVYGTATASWDYRAGPWSICGGLGVIAASNVAEDPLQLGEDPMVMGDLRAGLVF